ncbi:MAG: DUF2478 domain-containing protein [Rhodomicrobium sp.]
MRADPLKGALAALHGASSFEIQNLLARFAERRLRDGIRVAGVTEIAEAVPKGACRSLALREIGTGAQFPIAQDLGPGSAACNLDTNGLAAACARVLSAIEGGADVVVLSKFGKIEASGGGLLDCFAAAAGAGLPCVAGVSPALAAPFAEWAGDFCEWVEASDGALEAWWLARRSAFVNPSRPE